MNPQEMLSLVVERSLKEGASDVAASCVRGITRMVRFSNNEVTITKSWRSTVLSVLLMMDRRVVVGRIDDLSKRAVLESIHTLIKTAKVSRPNENYVPLPKGPFNYKAIPDAFDVKVPRMTSELIDYASAAIDAATSTGAQRAAGALFTQASQTWLLTSAGVEGEESGTSLEISVRAFAGEESSGHGVSSSRSTKGFHPEEAGRRAAEIALMARNPKEGESRIMDVVFGPHVFANFLSNVVDAASAFNVDAGLSFLAEKIGEKVASEGFTLVDDGTIPEGLNSRPFDDEGVPTQRTTIIDSGILKSYLHNSMTAKKFGTVTTGNAGWVAPTPWNTIVEPGPYKVEEMFGMVDDGLYVTNNWYTRFQDYRKGDFSTICRDGTFRIRKGEIAESLKGLRVSDNMLRILQNIAAISKERRWVRWWEVPLPTLTPYVLVKSVGITKSTK